MEIVAQLRDNIPAIASQGMLSTFGGAVDLGESPKQAAVRELEEETCLNTTYIKSCLHRPVLNSLFSSFASLAPSRLNHSNTTGIDITTQITGKKTHGKRIYCWSKSASCSDATLRENCGTDADAAAC
ncbi:MAG: NUDIX domain-containing protein [Microcoleus sp.]